jgi:hypothetical protein
VVPQDWTQIPSLLGAVLRTEWSYMWCGVQRILAAATVRRLLPLTAVIDVNAAVFASHYRGGMDCPPRTSVRWPCPRQCTHLHYTTFAPVTAAAGRPRPTMLRCAPCLRRLTCLVHPVDPRCLCPADCMALPRVQRCVANFARAQRHSSRHWPVSMPFLGMYKDGSPVRRALSLGCGHR